MRDHSMIEDGDHVLVGLSGGKDSMILLQALNSLCKKNVQSSVTLPRIIRILKAVEKLAWTSFI